MRYIIGNKEKNLFLGEICWNPNIKFFQESLVNSQEDAMLFKEKYQAENLVNVNRNTILYLSNGFTEVYPVEIKIVEE